MVAPCVLIHWVGPYRPRRRQKSTDYVPSSTPIRCKRSILTCKVDSSVAARLKKLQEKRIIHAGNMPGWDKQTCRRQRQTILSMASPSRCSSIEHGQEHWDRPWKLIRASTGLQAPSARIAVVVLSTLSTTEGPSLGDAALCGMNEFCSISFRIINVSVAIFFLPFASRRFQENLLLRGPC